MIPPFAISARDPPAISCVTYEKIMSAAKLFVAKCCGSDAFSSSQLFRTRVFQCQSEPPDNNGSGPAHKYHAVL